MKPWFRRIALFTIGTLICSFFSPAFATQTNAASSNSTSGVDTIDYLASAIDYTSFVTSPLIGVNNFVVNGCDYGQIKVSSQWYGKRIWFPSCVIKQLISSPTGSIEKVRLQMTWLLPAGVTLAGAVALLLSSLGFFYIVLLDQANTIAGNRGAYLHIPYWGLPWVTQP
jgi:hypothetical protein